MQRILLTGGSGCLGAELMKLNPNIICPTRSECDITNREQVLITINKYHPDIIIHAAAITDNRFVEKNPVEAINTNIIGSAILASECINRNIRLVYISTDYVYFDGSHGNYKETDPLLPFNLYSWTKLGGECSILAVKNHLIIRTSFGKNIFDYKEAFVDKWSSKDYVDVLAPLIYEATLSPLTGILNLGTDRKTLYSHASERSPETIPVKIEDRNFVTPYDTSLNLQKWINYKTSTSIAHSHDHCRVCGSNNLSKYLDLGLMPLANNLEFTAQLAKEKEKFPLQVMFCEDCGLSQLSVVINPEKLFSYYTYRSSVNKGYLKHCKEMAIDLKNKFDLHKNSLLIDIACFPSGSFVNTNRGYVDISNVTTLDRILSHDGEYHKVLNTFTKQYSGEFIKLKLRTLNTNITSTTEHPILTKRGWINASDLQLSDLIKTGNGIEESKLTKINLYNLAKLYHSFDVKIIEDKFISVSNGIKSELPISIDINKELLTVLGYYIGEGDGVGGSSIRFSFHHSTEDNKIEEIKEYLKLVLGLNSEIYIQQLKRSKCIRINSRILSSIFRAICGDGAYNKKIPSFIYKEEYIPHFIKALWFTDGHMCKIRKSRNNKDKNKTTYVYNSVSKNLVLDLRNLIETMGIQTSLQYVKNNRGFSKIDGTIYRLTIERNESVELFESLLNGNTLKFINNNRYCPILSIDKIGVKEESVFNLEIENTNTYICDGVVVHNCNDGSLLQEFKEEIGLKVLGVDPASNLTAIAEANGIPCITDFWGLHLIDQLPQKAQLITATNVFAHLDNVKEFIQACREALDKDGVLVIENPYLIDFIENMEFDTIYFEHVTYWSLIPMMRLCKDNNLKVINAEKQSIHGGTMRYTIARNDSKYAPGKNVDLILQQEKNKKFNKFERYNNWSEEVKYSIKTFETNLLNLKKQGKSIVGFAASAKGNTLLNSSGMTTDIISYIVDETSEKVGKYSPGTGIPIVYIHKIMKTNPDYIIILSWNFQEEIITKIRKLGYKGKYIIPIPEFTIID